MDLQNILRSLDGQQGLGYDLTRYLIDYFKGVEETRRLVGGEECITTVITYHEIMTGVRRLKARREETFFRRLFSMIKVLEYNVRAAEESSNIAANLPLLGGKSIPLMFLLPE